MKRIFTLLALVVTSDAFGESGSASVPTGSIIAVDVPPRTTNLCQGWSFVREDAQSEAARAVLTPAQADLVTKGTFPKGVAPQIIRCAPRTARYVCLETLSSYQGPYASVAEFDLLDEQGNALNRKNWKVVYADSEEIGSGDLAANAIDGNPQTKWHTQWTDGAPGQPHALVIDLHAPVRFAGFRYLPRQDGNTSGMTKDWKLFARTEPFKLPAAKDELLEVPRDAPWKTVCLPHSLKIESPSVNGKYFRAGCWYRREIAVDPAWAGRRVSLQFDGAMQTAVIFVNGAKIKTHLGGYLPFVVDLTPYLARHDRVTVALHLDNNASPAFPPGSNRIDFTYQGGLYRPVHLIVTDPVHISNAIEADRVAGGGVFVQCESADENKAVALAKTDVKNQGDKPATVSVEHVLLAPDGREVARQIVPAKTLAAGADEEFTSTMAVAKPQLWHMDGKVVATNTVRTPGKAVALRLRAATLGKPLRADGADAVFVYAEVFDATGEVVSDNKPIVEFKAKGAGRLIMPAASRAMAGIAPMLVQAPAKPGIITVSATADGLPPATLELRTESVAQSW